MKLNMEKIKGNQIENQVEKNIEKVTVGGGLLNNASQEQKSGMKKSEYIKIDDIDMHTENNMSMDNVPWLEQNILLNGLLQPLVVEQMDNGRYKLYAGHRRLTAIIRLKKRGEWGDIVEVKRINLEEMKLPEGVTRKTREQMALRSTNIQRDKTDADIYEEIKSWKDIYADLRKNGLEVFEYGVDDSENETITQQIKGVKTQKLVAEKIGISPAQVAKFDKVDNQGSDLLKEALKNDEITVATASKVADMPKEIQEKAIEKASTLKEVGEKITDAHIKESIENTKEKTAITPKEKEQGTIVTEKTFKADIKAILKALHTEERVLDEKAYMTYLKHLREIEVLITG